MPVALIINPNGFLEETVQLTRRLKAVAKQAYDEGARVYLGPLLRREAEQWRFTPVVNEGALEYAAALQALNDAAAGEVLDVGTGLASWPRLLADCGFHVTAIDSYSRTSYWSRRPFNRHFLIQEDDVASPRLDRQFDALTCMNVMSSIVDDSAAIAGMFRLVRANGLIVMSFPYNESRRIENVYELAEAGYGHEFLFPCRVYCRADTNRWLREQGGELVAQEYYRVFTGELWTMGQRIPPQKVCVDDPHHFTTITLRKSSGA